MKFREIFRFEFLYQARLVRTWLYFVVLFIAGFQLQGTVGNVVFSPFEIAQDTVLTSLLWVLMAPIVAGSAGARDVQTRMHSLIYAAPISKADYLGGRFLAAFALNALILLAVPLGIMAALLVAGVNPVGAFRSAVFLSSYVVLALPTAFTFTALQFSVAVLKRRAILSYLGTVVFFVAVGSINGLVTNVLHMPSVGKLLDPACRMNVANIMADTLTPLEKNTLMIALDGSILANRLLWLCLSSAILVFTYNRFRPGHREG